MIIRGTHFAQLSLLELVANGTEIGIKVVVQGEVEVLIQRAQRFIRICLLEKHRDRRGVSVQKLFFCVPIPITCRCCLLSTSTLRLAFADGGDALVVVERWRPCALFDRIVVEFELLNLPSQIAK